MSSFLALFNQRQDEKAKQMNEDQSLELIRHATDGQCTYISAKVHAEMRKTTSYSVDINANAAATVLEAQCECPVGLGPGAHCKHVQVVLYALCCVDEGMKTRETCTQVLQTFHQTRSYTGSPKKTSMLALGQGGSMESLPAFDPRPPHLRKLASYPNQFRNVWLNTTVPDLPIRQLMPPANIWGMCHDHAYAKLSPEEKLL